MSTTFEYLAKDLLGNTLECLEIYQVLFKISVELLFITLIRKVFEKSTSPFVLVLTAQKWRDILVFKLNVWKSNYRQFVRVNRAFVRKLTSCFPFNTDHKSFLAF